MTRIYQTKGQTALFPRVKPPRESHANRGMEFENELKVMHALYARRGLARIEKNYVPTQPVRNGQWAKVIGKAIVDFSGLTAGGRFVAFDAKDCVGHRIELDRLADHQFGYLGQVQALGGWAFVLVRFARQYVYRIPFDAWADAALMREGFKAETVDGWRPKYAASIGMADMKPHWAVDGVDWLTRRIDRDDNG